MRAFECPTKPACPRRSLNASEGGSFFDQSCNLGYDHNSPLCAMCASDPNPYNQYKVGTECVACADGRVNVPVVIVLGALALAATAAVITGAYSWLVDNGLSTDLRILIGLYQILSQAETVLMIALPDPLPTIIQVARALFLDIRDVIHMDCIDMGGLYAKIITNVFVLPLLAAAACCVYYWNETKTVDRLIREGVSDTTGLQSASMQLKRNLMVATFILYPTMTTTLFRVPMCRELGDQSYHEDDCEFCLSVFADCLRACAHTCTCAWLSIPVSYHLLRHSFTHSHAFRLGQLRVQFFSGPTSCRRHRSTRGTGWYSAWVLLQDAYKGYRARWRGKLQRSWRFKACARRRRR
jgi:hypothetical protein